MSGWREPILAEFTPQISRLTLVADPDGLLLEEGILEGIRSRGFELIPFEEHIAFRYAYEENFRSRWDRGEQTDLVVVLHSPAGDLSTLPYDLLQVGRKLSFQLGDIFPYLSYPVVKALDRGDLDALHTAQANHAAERLGDNATKEFILRHVFEIAPELIKQPADLLRMLLHRHYRRLRIPSILDARLVAILSRNPTFAEWPLELIVPDREAFLTFLQERWPIFLDRQITDETIIQEGRRSYGLAIPGPAHLPLDHHDIRVYVDSLFLDGQLQPIAYNGGKISAGSWVAIGVVQNPQRERLQRLERLIGRLETDIPAAADEAGWARHDEWLHFARRWAELRLLAYKAPEDLSEAMWQRIRALQEQVDAAFHAWLGQRYAGLINLPPAPPVMLHHLPRFLARRLEENPRAKLALVVIDGLALDQWLILRDALAFQEKSWRIREEAVFAWLPTITPVSRQAIFAGRAPIYFPDSLHTTDREPLLWRRFWEDSISAGHGLPAQAIVYERGLGDGSLEPVVDELTHPQTRVAGLVIDKVDRIMHGMELGTAGMHNQVRQWAEQGYLHRLFRVLLEAGFEVFLTADHGNVEAQGCGRPAEGSVADVRGERVRIYPDESLRSQVAARFPGAISWPPVGLPASYLPLLAPPRQAFVHQKERIVSHGGDSLEEVIVPWVQIEEVQP